jgi:hypothetical protein
VDHDVLVVITRGVRVLMPIVVADAAGSSSVPKMISRPFSRTSVECAKEEQRY